jgi:hypothetical protein
MLIYQQKKKKDEENGLNYKENKEKSQKSKIIMQSL